MRSYLQKKTQSVHKYETRLNKTKVKINKNVNKWFFKGKWEKGEPVVSSFDKLKKIPRKFQRLYERVLEFRFVPLSVWILNKVVETDSPMNALLIRFLHPSNELSVLFGFGRDFAPGPPVLCLPGGSEGLSNFTKGYIKWGSINCVVNEILHFCITSLVSY